MYRYLVTAIRTPQFEPSAVAAHHAFLERLRTLGKLELAGAFTDRSGGAYVLVADDLAEAERLAFSDPLHTTNSSVITVFEWNAK
ncbi:MAG: YciI family protein [Pseudomonadota bacterium]